MTRQEFLDNVEDFFELMDFCEQENIGYCSDIYDAEARDEYIDNEVEDMVRYGHASWTDVREKLDNYEDSSYSDYWLLDDYGWRALDDEDFRRIKNEILDYMDNTPYGWDENNESEDSENSEPVVEEETPEQPEEDLDTISIEDLFAQYEPISCNRREEKPNSPEQHITVLGDVQILF